MATRVLVVDDERSIADGLAYSLRSEGFAPEVAYDGERAIELFRETKPEIVILDIMLPGLDGYTVCRIIRKESQTPVIMLTARADRAERVLGFDAGADDYVIKPFYTDELIARIRAVLRRGTEPGKTAGALSVDGLAIDPSRRTVVKDGEQIEMSRKEFDLLYELARQPGTVVSREVLLTKIWGESSYIDPHTVDVHVCRVRDKLEKDPQKPALILTVRGIGYKLADASKA